MECGFFLNVVIGECTSILKLFACEDQALLIGWNSFLVLDFGLDIVNRVAGLDVESNRLAGQGFDEDLHATTQAQNKMECGFFLNVVIGECTSILKLFACEDQALLIWWNSFLVLDFGLDIVNHAGLDVER